MRFGNVFTLRLWIDKRDVWVVIWGCLVLWSNNWFLWCVVRYMMMVVLIIAIFLRLLILLLEQQVRLVLFVVLILLFVMTVPYMTILLIISIMFSIMIEKRYPFRFFLVMRNSIESFLLTSIIYQLSHFWFLFISGSEMKPASGKIVFFLAILNMKLTVLFSCSLLWRGVPTCVNMRRNVIERILIYGTWVLCLNFTFLMMMLMSLVVLNDLIMLLYIP